MLNKHFHAVFLCFFFQAVKHKTAKNNNTSRCLCFFQEKTCVNITRHPGGRACPARLGPTHAIQVDVRRHQNGMR